jgi:hypothetical protein
LQIWNYIGAPFIEVFYMDRFKKSGVVRRLSARPDIPASRVSLRAMAKPVDRKQAFSNVASNTNL